MAGGEGRRLRPLTENTPKPLLPVGGIPAIRRILGLLRENGITEAVITTGYLSDRIEEHLKDYSEMKLMFSREEIPLGTAGGVKAACGLFDGDLLEPLLIMSGDAVCEIDLSAALDYHLRQMADVTIVLSHAKNPLEYGVVMCDDCGRITNFVEKPSLSHAFADTVNTGIYIIEPKILSRIPVGKSYDFASQLFPDLLCKMSRLYGYSSDDYWCDIGDIASYYDSNMRYSFGETVMGIGCVTDRTATVEASVVMDGTVIESGCSIDGAIIGEGCIIGRNSSVGKNCVIGDGSIIGQGAVLTEGVVLPGNSRVPDGLIMQKSMLFSSVNKASELLSGKGIEYELQSLGSRFPYKLGMAVAEAAYSAVGGKTVGVMKADGAEEGAIYHQIIKGICAGGGECIALENGFEAAAAYAAHELNLDISVFIRESDGKASVFFFDADGLYPHRRFERALMLALTKSDPVQDVNPNSDIGQKKQTMGDVKSIDFIGNYYLPALEKAADMRLERSVAAIRRENMPSVVLTRAFLASGAQIGTLCAVDGVGNSSEKEKECGCLSYSLSPEGFDLSVCREDSGKNAAGSIGDSRIIDMLHVISLLLLDILKSGNDEFISLPVVSPLAVRRIAGEKLAVYSNCPCDSLEDSARAGVKAHPELVDGCFAAVKFASLIERNAERGISLDDMLKELPSFSVSRDKYKTDSPDMISAISKIGKPDGEGMYIRYESGAVRVVPEHGGYRLSSEAASGEYAEEIMDISKKKLAELLGEADRSGK